MKIKLTNDIKIYKPPGWLISAIQNEFKVTNPKWLENDRMGRYNRDTPKHIQFYKQIGKHIDIPMGAGTWLADLLEENNYNEHTLHDTRNIEDINLVFQGTLKPFQEKVLSELIKYTTGTLQAPTGSGKTVMALSYVAYRKQSTLVLVHTKDLAHQWVQRACQFLDLKPFEIGLMGDGHKQIGRRLTIGMIQTCYKQIPLLKKEFGLVIIDEAHRAPARLYTDILSEINCKYRLGLSATPYRRDGLNKIIEWYCGPIRHKVPKKMLVEQGHVMEPWFVMRSTDFIPKTDPVNEYSKMLSELTYDPNRNIGIVSDIIKYTQNVDVCALVISDRKAHCYLLADILKREGMDPLVLTGDTKKGERNQITDQIGNGKNLLIATGQLIGEGFDCKNLNMLFICTPIRFAGRVKQYIGRIMRPAEGKDRPVVFDYADWKVGVLARSAKGRMTIYGKENVKYEGRSVKSVVRKPKTKRLDKTKTKTIS